jgi:hypothetical protein
MRVAMVVGALFFSLVVTSIYEAGLIDSAASAEADVVHSFEDTMPPPSSWP